MKRVHTEGGSINITPFINDRCEEGEDRLTHLNQHRFDESDSEYDEDQFGNVDEDVINHDNSDNHNISLSIRNDNKNTEGYKFDYANNLKQNLRGRPDPQINDDRNVKTVILFIKIFLGSTGKSKSKWRNCWLHFIRPLTI
jgi:hypothetical protein